LVEYAGTSNGKITKERILVAPKDNEAAMAASFIHELSHYKLFHLDSDLDKETKEREAEVVSYIVTSYLGLKNEKSKSLFILIARFGFGYRALFCNC